MCVCVLGCWTRNIIFSSYFALQGQLTATSPLLASLRISPRNYTFNATSKPKKSSKKNWFITNSSGLFFSFVSQLGVSATVQQVQLSLKSATACMITDQQAEYNERKTSRLLLFKSNSTPQRSASVYCNSPRGSFSSLSPVLYGDESGCSSSRGSERDKVKCVAPSLSAQHGGRLDSNLSGLRYQQTGGGCSGVEGEEEEVVVVRKSVVEELLQIQNIQTQTFRCYQQNAN